MKKLLLIFVATICYSQQIVVLDKGKLCKVGNLLGWKKDNPIYSCKKGKCIMSDKAFWYVADIKNYKKIKSKYKCERDK